MLGHEEGGKLKSILRELAGPLAALVASGAVELLRSTWLQIPNPPAVLFLAIVFAAFTAGLRSALVSALLGWSYLLYYLVTLDQPHGLSDENIGSLALWALVFTAVAVMVGVLKKQSERSLRSDIIQLRKVEAELRTAERRTRSIHEAFIGMNDRGLITDWNHAAETTFGWPKDLAIGRTLAELIIPERFRDAHRKGLERFLKTGEGPVLNRRFEISALHRSGREFPVELTISPIKADDGMSFASFLHDISERKESERRMTELNHELEKGVKERTEELAVANNQLKEQVVERERLYGQARTASRLKDEFLATVSHELRTPLNVIQGNSELLKSENLNVEETREAIDAIYRNSKTQAQIINDLLDVSRIISGKLQLTIEPLDLGQAVQNAIETIKIAAAAKNISVNTEIDASVGPVAADATRLQQVIWNILSNAVKFTPKGGKIQVNLGRDGSRARLQIADTGKGIEPHFLPYVFDRFRQEDSTTTRRYGGLGLGLSIARHIVESHGGTIEAVSEGKSKGATFIVCLPLLAVRIQPDRQFTTPSATKQTTETRVLARRLTGIRVLVVDDDDDSRALLKSILKRSGAEVVTAASAEEALSALEDVRPEILVSDISMPDMDGYELIRRVRKLPRESGGTLPAVALTAYARDEERQRALNAGFQMHVAKPVDASTLLDAIANLVRHAEAVH